MIPPEVSAIASIIMPEWTDADDLTLNEVLEAAWRIYNAGYRIPQEEKELQAARARIEELKREVCRLRENSRSSEIGVRTLGPFPLPKGVYA